VWILFAGVVEQSVLFYFYGYVHRRSILITVQRDATKSNLFIILQIHSTCFGCQPHPSSGVHKTVTTASGTVQLLEGGSCTKIWPVPEAVVTVLCTTDDGCGWPPKHVEWTCRIINRLLCVAYRWTITNICFFIFIGVISRKNNRDEIVGVFEIKNVITIIRIFYLISLRNSCYCVI